MISGLAGQLQWQQPSHLPALAGIASGQLRCRAARHRQPVALREQGKQYNGVRPGQRRDRDLPTASGDLFRQGAEASTMRGEPGQDACALRTVSR